MGVTPCFFFAPKDKKAAAKDMVILCRRSYCGVSIRLLTLIVTIEESNNLSAGAVIVRAEQTTTDAAGDAVLLRPFHGFVKAQGLIHNSLWL